VVPKAYIADEDREPADLSIRGFIASAVAQVSLMGVRPADPQGPNTLIRESRKSSRSIAIILREPKFNWKAEFADSEYETLYREKDVHTAWCYRALLLTIADGLLFGGAFLARTGEQLGVGLSGFAYTALGLFFLEIFVGALTFGALRRKVPLLFSELGVTCALIAVPLASSFFTIDEGEVLPSYNYHLEAPMWFPSDYASVHLILLSRFMLVGTFTPIRSTFFGIVLICNLFTLLCGDVVVSNMSFKKALMLLLSVLVMSSLLVVVNVRIALIHRGRHFFISEMETAMIEREKLIRHETEQEVKEKAGDEERASRSRLIRMVMHDLRSPLLSIGNIAHVLANMPAGTRVHDPAVERCVESLTTCSSLTQSIISDMLDFERIDSGRLVLVRAPFLLRELLFASQAIYEGLAKARRVALTFKPLPVELQELYLDGDMRRLTQCLNNGISNALKFSDAGGCVDVSAELHVCPIRGSPWQCLSIFVKDCGIGLSESDLKILRKGAAFTQVGRGRQQGSSGSGLGISIAKQICAMHGSSNLSLESAGYGKGTTFTMAMMLPASKVEAKLPRNGSRPGSKHCSGAFEMDPLQGSAVVAMTGPKWESEPDLDSKPVFPPGFRCLLVEDDKFLQLTTPLRIFAPLGLEVDLAENGAVALQIVTKLRGPKYSVICMDNQMPLMDGTACTRALRAAGFAGAILGMTGDQAGCYERNEFEASGLDSCYDKNPAGIDAIIKHLRTFADLIGADDADPTGADDTSAALVSLDNSTSGNKLQLQELENAP